MDPSIFLHQSPPNGLPQESKLATYMSRSPTTCAVVPNLLPHLSKLSLEPDHIPHNKVPGSEYIPIRYVVPAAPAPMPPPPSICPEPPHQAHVHHENVGGTTYFYSTDGINGGNGVNTGVNSTSSSNSMVGASGGETYMHVLQHPNQDGVGMPAGPAPAASWTAGARVRAEVARRIGEELAVETSPRDHYDDLPENVEMYTNLVPLGAGDSGAPRWYRAEHRRNGMVVALCRVPAPPHHAGQRLNHYLDIDHPNLVRLVEHFTTGAFDDHSAVMVYEWIWGGESIRRRYLSGDAPDPDPPHFLDPFSADPLAPRPYTHQKNAMLRAVACGAMLPESVVWSVLVQLTAALRILHTNQLAAGCVTARRVLVSGSRVRLSACGLSELTHPHSAADLAQAQQEDLRALGRLALSLASRSSHVEHAAGALERVGRAYSGDLHRLIVYLLAGGPQRRCVSDLMPMIGARFYTQLEVWQRRADAAENHLQHEVDNGRLLHLVLKLGAVTERADSDTGSRYLLQLFRDHVLHAVTADGGAWLDRAHVAHALNNLDAGSPLRVELVSRDDQTVLVVSYAELKHCLDTAFDELMNTRHSAHSPPAHIRKHSN